MVDHNGLIEQLSEKQARGWIHVIGSPETHPAIVATLHQQVLGTAVANLYRDDLKAAGVGNGDHAFVVNFREILPAEDIGAVKVRAVFSDATTVLLDRIDPIGPTQGIARQETAPEPPSDRTGQQTPLFILGAARSGTSAMAQGLLQSKVYEGFEEGHLLDLAGILIRTIRDFYDDNAEELGRDTLISQVSPRVFDEGIKDQFRAIPRFRFRGGRWLDKTPRRGMIRNACFLKEIWPTARFIFMKRRGIENLCSRKRKFSTTSFKESCDDWSGTMMDWREVRPLLGDPVMEIEQLDMALDPATVASTVSKFLDLNEADASRFARTLAAEQPERTSPRFAEILDFDRLDWADEEKEIFKASCAAEMAAYGYSFDGSYLVGP